MASPAKSYPMNDLNGSSGPRMDENEIRSSVLEAAQSFPDEKEKQPFFTAMRVAGDLVRSESDPLKFFRIESGSVDRAARRLIAYWALRKRVFGDRAFLPMDLTGQGAMDEKDIEVLRSGCLMLLPKDSRGRNVMFFDRTKSVHLKGQGQDPDGLATSVHKPRCSFYLLSVASEEDAPLVYVPYGNSPKWGIGKRNGASAVLTILPIQLDGCISLFAVSEGASRGFKHAVVPVYEKFIREQNYGCQIATYVKESPSDLALALTKHDMSSQSLPQVAGGTWTHQDFLKWLESRRLVELGRKSNLDSRLPAQQARISSQSSGTLSSGLLFTARECLRESDSSANDFASKLLLLHMLKQLSLSTGPTAHLPMLELSDQTSALAKYLEELEQKKRRETNSRGQLIGLLETPLENLPSPSNSDFADDLLSLSLSHDGATRSVESIVAQLSGQGFARTNAMANGAPECHVHFSERDIDQLLVDLSLGQHTRPSKRSCMAEDTCDEVVKDVAREFLQELIESRHDVPLSSEEDPPTDTTTVDTLSYVIESSL